MCLCKDTNFKANHNIFCIYSISPQVVCAYAKILILKQITTERKRTSPFRCCMCLCKDTNFKANHNAQGIQGALLNVVCAYAKILILKQITTRERR